MDQQTTPECAAPGDERSLDPGDWDEMRTLGGRMVEDMLRWLETLRERPVWKPVPEDVKAFFRRPLPEVPEAATQVYEQFQRYILPYAMGNAHPAFWGWVMGNGTATGMLAEMLAAGMNPNVGGAEHGAIYVERQVTAWTREMIGFPEGASGLLVSGGSMANLVGLTVARNARAGWDIRRAGLQGEHPRLVLYASSETHSSVQKAVELLGLGSEALRVVPVDDEYRIDLFALREMIAADRSAGCLPFCLVGNAVTVNTGAIDPLLELATIAHDEGLWYHVDGAIGALAAVSPAGRRALAGMEQADSVALDFHKWFYMQFEAGCVVVRDAEAHRKAFSVTPEYLASHGDRGLAAGADWPTEYGVQLSRGFRALKIWMSLKEHGVERYSRLVEQNIAQAQYLGGLVAADPLLELVAPIGLNIVCFRFNPGGLADDSLNPLNQQLLIRLHESGAAAPSYTTLRGRYALRAAITNHRSTRGDFDMLVREVVRIGRELLASH
jgi:glutamate/tyrosine decarboxylase-like PLP-dependent enzyme